MLESFKHIVLITGCQRSGTTLLSQIFGAHPNAFMIDELEGVYEWFDAFTEHTPNAKALWHRMLVAANTKYRASHKRLISAKDGESSTCQDGITHLILQAPDLLYQYQAFAQLNLPISVIYPVRDPRSVVASMTKLHFFPMIQNQLRLIQRNRGLTAELADDLKQLAGETVPEHIKRAIVWRIKSNMQDRFDSLDMPVLSFRYEDFVVDTPRFCRQIAEHVGLAADPAMLSHQTAYRGFGPGFTERARPVDRNSLATWSDRLSTKQEQDILRITRTQMRALGYGDGSNTRLETPAVAIADDELIKPLIFTGRGGSGTRVLSQIANAHGIFLGNRSNASGDSVEWVDLIYEMVINHQRGEPPLSGWEALLQKKAQTILSQSEWQPGRSWGWKLPETMVVIPEMFKAFPDAKLIHLVRHPVNSALRRTHVTSRTDSPVGLAVLRAAYTKAGRDKALIAEDKDYLRNAITWLYQVENVARFGREQLSSEQYLEIRFEDICAEPERVLAQFSDFTGLPQAGLLEEVINTRRAAGPAIEDSRVEEVWKLCGSVAEELGYTSLATSGQ